MLHIQSCRGIQCILGIWIKSWVDKMQEDLVTLARTASGVEKLAEIYKNNKDLYTVEANNPRQLVEIAARDIEKLLSNRSKALVVEIRMV
ncbi:Voltage-dependent calcium channel subunit alpha-2/delta-1 [Pitangus sulphuratus]|nr:Voltage-dependent calcium channel subunit alpha-2/delta-1 [Pitangus sulphuratus]